jgi:FAD binding domain
VQWALKSSTPFVARSGGHSEWSTIGKNGVIIDLGRYKSVEIDEVNQTAILKGSILSKEVAVALADAGMFTGKLSPDAIQNHNKLVFTINLALGNGNTVGAIPYFLNGGASITTSITGFGADQILAARLITASGELIEVNQTHNADLLWALRGAGQFFGLVTELTVKTHPLSALGNDRGVIWAGSFVFPLDRAGEVAAVMKDLMDNSHYATAGLLMIMAPPPTRQPSLVVATRYTGDPQEAASAYQYLYDLKPIAAPGGEVPIQNASDARNALGAKGDFKRFSVIGLQRFDPEAFLKTVYVWKEMTAQCPDAINTAFNFQWDARPPRKSDLGSAHCLQDVRYWQYV